MEAINKIKDAIRDIHRELTSMEYEKTGQYDAIDNMQDALNRMENDELKKLQDAFKC